MSWQDQLKGGSLSWLLEPGEPTVRHLALRDLLDTPSADPDLCQAREAAHTEGPISTVLAAMHSDGYWVKPGPGYNPKYRSAVWSLILLAQLGASLEADPRLARACSYLLEHALTEAGQFSTTGTPSNTIDCLQGNLCWALLELGLTDPRLDSAFDWMARSVTGEGIAPCGETRAALRYYAYKCGPGFACGVNNKLPCAWGATKVLLAFGKWPKELRTPLMERAIRQAIDFIFSIDPAKALYPTWNGAKPNRDWWKFGFPVFYITDLLQIAEALVSLGVGNDPRLASTLALIREKQDEHGRWALEYGYSGKTWVDLGMLKQPNKWVTLRALRVLKRSAAGAPA